MNDVASGMTTEQALSTASQLLESWLWALEAERPEPNRLDVILTSPDELVPVVVALRVKRLGYLSAITGLDLGLEAGQLEILYHLCAGAAVITLRLRLPREAAIVPTLSEIIPSAEVFEREMVEMLGVTVTGLRTPEYLYLPDDWPPAAYPLRKDFEPQAIP
jgi:NADH:ubiquinone oxidoreductase subunit C